MSHVLSWMVVVLFSVTLLEFACGVWCFGQSVGVVVHYGGFVFVCTYVRMYTS